MRRSGGAAVAAADGGWGGLGRGRGACDERDSEESEGRAVSDGAASRQPPVAQCTVQRRATHGTATSDGIRSQWSSQCVSGDIARAVAVHHCARLRVRRCARMAQVRSSVSVRRSIRHPMPQQRRLQQRSAIKGTSKNNTIKTIAKNHSMTHDHHIRNNETCITLACVSDETFFDRDSLKCEKKKRKKVKEKARNQQHHSTIMLKYPQMSLV